MKKIAIFGAGGFGREVAFLIEDINKKNCQWKIIGFLDNTKKNEIINDYKVLGGLEELNKIKENKAYSEPYAQGPAKKALNINPTEKLLIKLMLEEDELISRIRERLEPADFQDERTARIVSLMFDLIGQGKNIEPNKLINYLDDESISQIICESTLSPQIPEQNKENIINDCIQRLKNERLKIKKQRLHEQIKTAQTLGDEEKLHRLMQEFDCLIKER